jgi:hypothetical protein
MNTADIMPLLARFALTGRWGPLAMNAPLSDTSVRQTGLELTQ